MCQISHNGSSGNYLEKLSIYKYMVKGLLTNADISAYMVNNLTKPDIAACIGKIVANSCNNA